MRACYVADMHAWQPTRLAAALTAAESAGLSKSAIARIAGVHRSQVSRWFSGEQRPGYDPAMRIAGYLRLEQPDLAAEFTAAAGYGGPVEPGPEPEIPPSLVASINRFLPEEKRQPVIDAIRRTLAGIPPEEPAGEESDSSHARRAG